MGFKNVKATNALSMAKAYTCLGCHGVEHYVNTYPSYHVPKIAGQHVEYLVAALQAYRAKTRSHPTMQANAALLSDQETLQPARKRRQPAQPAMVLKASLPTPITPYWPGSIPAIWNTPLKVTGMAPGKMPSWQGLPRNSLMKMQPEPTAVAVVLCLSAFVRESPVH